MPKTQNIEIIARFHVSISRTGRRDAIFSRRKRMSLMMLADAHAAAATVSQWRTTAQLAQVSRMAAL